MILVDTGPLVALIHQDDNQHRICKETFLTFSEPLGTVWPVLTEALHLLNFSFARSRCRPEEEGAITSEELRRRLGLKE